MRYWPKGPGTASVNDPVPESYILDSFALLAYLEDEAGAARVEALLEQAREKSIRLWMSIVNLGEVLYITERERGLPHSRKTLALVEQLPLEIVDADRSLTLAAAHIKACFAVSYADTFAISLARLKNACVITGDPEFLQVESLVSIEWLPR